MTIERWRKPVETMLELTEGEKDRVAQAFADVAARLSSDHSRRAYAADWQAWCQWCSDTEGLPILEAKPTDVQRHLMWLNEVAARKTVQRRLTVLRQVYGALEVHALVARNPAREVKAPASQRPAHRPWLSAGQLAALVRACGSSNWVDQRDRLLVLVLATTGLRRAEVARLTPANLQRIDFGALVISVATKGGKQITVSVPSGIDSILEQWAESVRAARGTAASLWSRDRKPLGDGRIAEVVRLRAARAGLPEGLATPHALRRTFATLASLSGVELRELQAALGHAQVSTTETYVRAALPASVAPGEAVARSLEIQRATETCAPSGVEAVCAEPGRAKR